MAAEGGNRRDYIRGPMNMLNLISDPSPRTVARRSTMIAAAIAEPRHIELLEVPIPEPGPREMRVRVEGCGVCASNIAPWEGRPWFEYPMSPGTPGHEGWGYIDAIGSEVVGFEEGDRVAFLSSRAFAEWDITYSNSAIKLPKDFASLPFPGEPLGCAMNILKRSGIKPGETVAIIGIGFLGTLLTQLAVKAGARVIGIARKPDSLAMARAFGASDVFLSGNIARRKSLVEVVRKCTGGKFCDVVIEAAGKQETLDLASELVRERGRLVIAGYHQDGPRQVNMQLWNWRGLDVINAHEREPAVYLSGMRSAIEAVKRGIISPGALYTHQLPLSRLGEALEMAAQRPAGFIKALVRMEMPGQDAWQN